jgi:hypothetical protein
MSREIEFRAWHEDAKEYCEGSVSNMFKWVEDGQPVLLEQFTGLLDCNGVKIFEGDIVDDGEHYFSVISWDDDDAMFNASDVGALADMCSPIKVIGNIHQNHDLLP